jgi:hypothetical protein
MIISNTLVVIDKSNNVCINSVVDQSTINKFWYRESKILPRDYSFRKSVYNPSFFKKAVDQSSSSDGDSEDEDVCFGVSPKEFLLIDFGILTKNDIKVFIHNQKAIQKDGLIYPCFKAWCVTAEFCMRRFTHHDMRMVNLTFALRCFGVYNLQDLISHNFVKESLECSLYLSPKSHVKSDSLRNGFSNVVKTFLVVSVMCNFLPVEYRNSKSIFRYFRSILFTDRWPVTADDCFNLIKTMILDTHKMYDIFFVIGVDLSKYLKNRDRENILKCFNSNLNFSKQIFCLGYKAMCLQLNSLNSVLLEQFKFSVSKAQQHRLEVMYIRSIKNYLCLETFSPKIFLTNLEFEFLLLRDRKRFLIEYYCITNPNTDIDTPANTWENIYSGLFDTFPEMFSLWECCMFDGTFYEFIWCVHLKKYLLKKNLLNFYIKYRKRMFQYIFLNPDSGWQYCFQILFGVNYY